MGGGDQQQTSKRNKKKTSTMVKTILRSRASVIVYLGWVRLFSSICSHSYLCNISVRRNQDSMSTSSDPSFCLDEIVASSRMISWRKSILFMHSSRTIVFIITVKWEYRGLFVLPVEFVHFILFTDVSIEIQHGSTSQWFNERTHLGTAWVGSVSDVWAM